ncbi:alpha/beta hydrolase [Microbispora sp. RL4-1S]|uniref:Alpha/beta hydrolase n=1 Tax=Microbispora oryzae TaxID=2806554 RepID=A0A941ARY1_9ACTN|nr:alpha/beta hydrolase [Microbispora oryzae]MBP2706859.1 alpha/beta hydrolase [Microbispora oryzae]
MVDQHTAGQHTVATNGIRTAYRVWGEEGSSPVVLLHALGEDAAGWDRVASEIAAAGHRVYGPDLRGHGGSEWPGVYSLELMRDDVAALLDALGLDQVDLVGHSMGGAVAYLFAQAQPRRVRRLVLEDVPPPLPRPRTVPERPEGPLAFDWAMVTAVRAQIDDPDPAWLDGLRRITAPALVVAGGPDSHIPQERTARMPEWIPDCRVVTIPAGHLVHAMAPGPFLDAVLAFLHG